MSTPAASAPIPAPRAPKPRPVRPGSEHDRLVRRMLAWYREDLTFAEMARRLNAEGVPAPGGGPWAPAHANRFLRMYGGVEVDGRARWGALRSRAHRDYYAPIVRRIAAWFAEGLTHPEIARRLNAEGCMIFNGEPWTPEQISKISRHHEEDAGALAARAEAARSRGAHARARVYRERYGPLAREIVERFDASWSFAEIAEQLRKEGKKRPGGGPLNAGIVGRIVRDYTDGLRPPIGEPSALGPGGGRRRIGGPWARRRAELCRRAIGVMVAYRRQGLTFTEIARRLNAEGIESLSGRPWRRDSVSEAMHKHARDVISKYKPSSAKRRPGRARPPLLKLGGPTEPFSVLGRAKPPIPHASWFDVLKGLNEAHQRGERIPFDSLKARCGGRSPYVCVRAMNDMIRWDADLASIIDLPGRRRKIGYGLVDPMSTTKSNFSRPPAASGHGVSS